MANGSNIIIKGTAAEVVFNHEVYEEDPQMPSRHINENKKITRVVITGDLNYDSGENEEGWDCEITAHCS